MKERDENEIRNKLVIMIPRINDPIGDNDSQGSSKLYNLYCLVFFQVNAQLVNIQK